MFLLHLNSSSVVFYRHNVAVKVMKEVSYNVRFLFAIAFYLIGSIHISIRTRKEAHLNKLHPVIKYNNMCYIRSNYRNDHNTFEVVFRYIVVVVAEVVVVVRNSPRNN